MRWVVLLPLLVVSGVCAIVHESDEIDPISGKRTTLIYNVTLNEGIVLLDDPSARHEVESVACPTQQVFRSQYGRSADVNVWNDGTLVTGLATWGCADHKDGKPRPFHRKVSGGRLISPLLVEYHSEIASPADFFREADIVYVIHRKANHSQPLTTENRSSSLGHPEHERGSKTQSQHGSSRKLLGFFGDIFGAVEYLGDAAGDAAADVGEGVVDVGETIGDVVVQGAEGAASVVAGVGEDLTDAAVDAAEDVTDAAIRVAKFAFHVARDAVQVAVATATTVLHSFLDVTTTAWDVISNTPIDRSIKLDLLHWNYNQATGGPINPSIDFENTAFQWENTRSIDDAEISASTSDSLQGSCVDCYASLDVEVVFKLQVLLGVPMSCSVTASADADISVGFKVTTQLLGSVSMTTTLATLGPLSTTIMVGVVPFYLSATVPISGGIMQTVDSSGDLAGHASFKGTASGGMGWTQWLGFQPTHQLTFSRSAQLTEAEANVEASVLFSVTPTLIVGIDKVASVNLGVKSSMEMEASAALGKALSCQGPNQQPLKFGVPVSDSQSSGVYAVQLGAQLSAGLDVTLGGAIHLCLSGDCVFKNNFGPHLLLSSSHPMASGCVALPVQETTESTTTTPSPYPGTTESTTTTLSPYSETTEFTPTTTPSPAVPPSASQSWVGVYVGNQGATQGMLDISSVSQTGAVQGVFTFSFGLCYGSYALSGSWEEQSSTMSLSNIGAWVIEPECGENFSPIGFIGQVVGSTWEGTVEPQALGLNFNFSLSAVLSVVPGVPTSLAATATGFTTGQTWGGTYNCLKPLGFHLYISSVSGAAVEGTLSFFAAACSSSYIVSGSMDSTGTIALLPGDWTSANPCGMVAVGLQGSVGSNGRFTGTVVGSDVCSTFSVFPLMNLVMETLEGASAPVSPAPVSPAPPFLFLPSLGPMVGTVWAGSSPPQAGVRSADCAFRTIHASLKLLSPLPTPTRQWFVMLFKATLLSEEHVPCITQVIVNASALGDDTYHLTMLGGQNVSSSEDPAFVLYNKCFGSSPTSLGLSTMVLQTSMPSLKTMVIKAEKTLGSSSTCIVAALSRAPGASPAPYYTAPPPPPLLPQFVGLSSDSGPVLQGGASPAPHGLQTWAVALIVVGAVVATGALALAFLATLVRRRAGWRREVPLAEPLLQVEEA